MDTKILEEYTLTVRVRHSLSWMRLSVRRYVVGVASLCRVHRSLRVIHGQRHVHRVFESLILHARARVVRRWGLVLRRHLSWPHRVHFVVFGSILLVWPASALVDKE